MKKAYKGGYKIISLAGVDLTTGGTIKGIYEAIESSYRKPLLIEDVVVDGVEKQSVFVNELKVVDGSYVIEVYGYELTIADDDSISIDEIGKLDIEIESDDVTWVSFLNEDSDTIGKCIISPNEALNNYPQLVKVILKDSTSDNTISLVMNMSDDKSQYEGVCGGLYNTFTNVVGIYKL